MQLQKGFVNARASPESVGYIFCIASLFHEQVYFRYRARSAIEWTRKISCYDDEVWWEKARNVLATRLQRKRAASWDTRIRQRACWRSSLGEKKSRTHLGAGCRPRETARYNPKDEKKLACRTHALPKVSDRFRFISIFFVLHRLFRLIDVFPPSFAYLWIEICSKI